MARKGRALELLVKSLEVHFSGEEATIESPAFLVDRITGQKRELDVLVTKGLGHHQHRIAFECRDRKVPIGNPDVEGFKGKIADLDIQKAVMVSSSGFIKKAIEKAGFYGISCLELSDIDKADFLHIGGFQSYELIILHVYVSLDTDGTGAKPTKDIKIVDSEGDEITLEMLQNTSREVLMSKLQPSACEVERVYDYTFNLNIDGLGFLDNLSGKITPITVGKIKTEFKVVLKDSPSKSIIYREADGGEICKALVSEVDLGDSKSHIAMIESGDGTIKVVQSHLYYK
jgi:hypothetical protein